MVLLSQLRVAAVLADARGPWADLARLFPHTWPARCAAASYERRVMGWLR